MQYVEKVQNLLNTIEQEKSGFVRGIFQFNDLIICVTKSQSLVLIKNIKYKIMFIKNRFARNIADILAEKSDEENDEYSTMKEESSSYPVSTFSFKADNHPIDKKRVKTQLKSEIPKSECKSEILKTNANPDSQYSFFKQEMKPEELHYEGNSVLWNLNYLSFNLPRRQSQFQLPQVPRFCVNEKSWYQEFKEIKEREKIPKIVDPDSFIQAANIISEQSNQLVEKAARLCESLKSQNEKIQMRIKESIEALEEKMGFVVVKTEKSGSKLDEMSREMQNFIQWKSQHLVQLGTLVELYWITIKSFDLLRLPIYKDHTRRFNKKECETKFKRRYLPREVKIGSTSKNIECPSLNKFTAVVGVTKDFIAITDKEKNQTAIFRIDREKLSTKVSFLQIVNQEASIMAQRDDLLILDKTIYLYNSEFNTLEHFQTFVNHDTNAGAFPLRQDIMVFGLKKYGRFAVYKFDPSHGKYMFLTKPHIKIRSCTQYNYTPLDKLKYLESDPEVVYTCFTDTILKFSIDALINCSNNQQESIAQKQIAIFGGTVLEFHLQSDLYIVAMTKGKVHLVNQVSDQILFKTDILPSLTTFELTPDFSFQAFPAIFSVHSETGEVRSLSWVGEIFDATGQGIFGSIDMHGPKLLSSKRVPKLQESIESKIEYVVLDDSFKLKLVTFNYQFDSEQIPKLC